MTVLITISSSGANSGPLYNLYSNIDYGTPLASGVTKSELEGGYSLLGVPDTATIIRITSTGTCTNYIDVTIIGITTTTTTTIAPTTTTTTTALIYPTLSIPTACSSGSPSGTVRISGGVNGDTIIVRILYSGVVGTDLATNTVSTFAEINSLGPTFNCYAVNTGTHNFTMDGNVSITLTGPSMDVSTSIGYRNGTSFILYNKYVQIISYNGVTVSGPQLGTICSGNDSGPAC